MKKNRLKKTLIYLFFAFSVVFLNKVSAQTSLSLDKENEKKDVGNDRINFFKEIERLPIWNESVIKYSDKMSKLVYSKSPEIQARKLNNASFNIFPKSVIYFDFDKQDYMELGTDQGVENESNLEPVALLLGRIKLSKNDWGLLVLESGFYSLTAIFLYPYSNTENVCGQGLEVADYFGDDNSEIIISSKISNLDNGSRIQTTVVFKDRPNSSSSGEKIKIRKVKRSWSYKEGIGFESLSGLIGKK